MARRIYIVPKVGDGLGINTSFRPKYISAGIVGPWQAMDLGLEPLMLVCAEVTAAENTSISANADVITVPADLDSTLGANLATVQAKLESVNIPAGWVTSGMTYRTVVRWVTRYFQFHQMFNGAFGAIGKFFAAGFTLDSTVGDLPVLKRQQINQVAQNRGLDTSAITLATTIRAALKILADQIPFAPAMGGVTL